MNKKIDEMKARIKPGRSAAGPLILLVFVLLGTACDRESYEQAKRYRESQKAIAAFDKQLADEQPSNWDEPRLLAVLASSDPSDRAKAARELGLRRTANARRPLRELMLRDTNGGVVNESELALIRIGHPDDIAAIRDYATPRVDRLDGGFLLNLSLLDDP